MQIQIKALGTDWYRCKPGFPVMIVLMELDRQAIPNIKDQALIYRNASSVKIGRNWYTSETEGDIVIQFNDQDILNIKNMALTATRYALFDEEDRLTADQKSYWMDN